MKRKIISLFLILAVLAASSICPAVLADEAADAAADTAVAEQEQPVVENADSYEMTVLKALGIIDESAKYDDTLTRAGILPVLFKLLNYSGSGEATQIYADVPSTDSNAANINTATKLGIISGSTDGNFYPNNELSVENAVKMLVCIMGYGQKAEALGGYPGGYYRAASSVKMSIPSSDKLNIGGLSQMIYSILDEEVVDADEISTDGSITYGKSETLLERMDMKKTEGIFSANDVTDIYNKKTAADGHITVDGEKIKSSVDCGELLGCKVIAYSKLDLNDNAELLYIEADGGYEEVTYDNIMNNRTVLDDMYVKAYREDSSKQKEYKLETNPVILYNGVVSDVYSNKVFDITNGKIVLIDNDSDNRYEVVNIITAVTSVSSGYVTTAELISVKNGSAISVNHSNFMNNVVIMTKDGAAMNADGISDWGIVSAYYNKPEGYTGRKLVKIVVSQDTVSGTVEGESNRGSGTKVLKIGGVDYDVSADFRQGGELISVSLGTSATFMLNLDGEIIAAKADMLSDLNTLAGVIVDAKNFGNLSTDYQLKIFNQNGQMVTPKLAKKVELDGKTVDAKDVINWFSPNGKNVTREVIRYKLNQSEEINFIDTANKTAYEDDTSLTRVLSSSDEAQRWRTGVQSFGGFYNIGSSTKTFSIPKDASASDDDYASDVRKFTEDKFYNLDVYITDNPFSAYAMMLEDVTSSSMRQSEMYVIQSVSKTVDENGDDKYKIEAAGYTALAEYYMDEKVYKKHNLAPGDIICKSMKTTTEIDSINVIYDYSEDKFFSEENPSTGFSGAHRIINCYAYEKRGTFVSMALTKPTEEITEMLESRNFDKYKKYIYDPEHETVTAATVADIIDYLSGGSDCSHMFVSEDAAYPGTCIIYK